MHRPHFTHFEVSMTCVFFRSPVIAPTGQFLAQRVHPVHFAGSMLNVTRARQFPAGHLWSVMCASYSSLKYRRVLRTGLGAVWPSPQRLASLIFLARSSSFWRSAGSPSQRVIRWRISSILSVPTRQKVHLPHDSL
jgi:hypothetical protein